jgi:hypothetical protein
MSLLRWIWAYLFDCVHSHTTWPHQNQFGIAYVCCLDCGREMPYSLEFMGIVGQDRKRNLWDSRSPATAPLIIAAALLLAPSHAIAQSARAQTACEAEMLGQMDAHEVFSGKAYEVLTDVARAYRRPVPRIYTLPESWNMAYIAGSTAVDGRGKILIGQQAIERFKTIALKGFLRHEMAHLVSDRAAAGCNDYVLRDPQMEADADALAASRLGRRPVKAFLEQALALTEGQNWGAKRRLQLLQ